MNRRSLLTSVVALAVPTPAGTVDMRPFGSTALWNIPIAGMSVHASSAVYATKVWNSVNPAGNINLTNKDYSYPVYDANNATKLYTVKLRNPTWGNIHGKKIPWNPLWKPSHGYWTGNRGVDSQAIVIDPDDGREWDLWQVSQPTATTLTCSSGSLIPGSYWDRTTGYRPVRGSGIPYYAMLAMAWEVESGAIEHALSMPFHGIHKSQFVAPATKTDGDKFGVTNGVPMGTRFALDVTQDNLDDWVDTLPLTTKGKDSAMVIGTALKVYGFVITDNSGSSHIQLEDVKSAGTRWASLGLVKTTDTKAYPRDLLDGLLTEGRIVAYSV